MLLVSLAISNMLNFDNITERFANTPIHFSFQLAMMNQNNKIPIDKIQSFIEMAVQEQLSWQTLAPVLDELTPTVAISKQVIKILLTELETLQSKTKNNKVVSCSNCEQSSPVIQIDETENQIQEKDEFDWTNEVIETDQEDETFDIDTEAVKDHVISEEEHSVDSKHPCPKCDEIFISRIEFKKHEKVHEISSETLKKLLDSGEKLYTFVGDGDTDILDQSGTEKEVNIVRSVKGIDKEVKTKKYVGETIQETKLKCSTCSKAFKYRHHLTKHETIHSKPFQCKTCEKYFSLKRSLIAHEIQIHSNEKPYQCTSCPKSFSWKSKFELHKMIHTGEVPFQCKICKKRFNLKGNLTKHEIIHSSEKPYKCETCHKTFHQSQSLSTHIQIHTGEKSYSCTSCEKGFSTKQQLERHERIHTGEKPFSCTTCSKTFKSSFELTTHIRIHTGEKPYKCQTCGKCFTTKTNLNQHEKACSISSQS